MKSLKIISHLAFIALCATVLGQTVSPAAPVKSHDKAEVSGDELDKNLGEVNQPLQTPVKVSSNGSDIHQVLSSLFSQAKQQYIIEPGIHFSLFLYLDGIPYSKALRIICDLAALETETVDGVVIVRRRNLETKPHPRLAVTATKVIPDKRPETVIPSYLPASVLAHKISTKLAKTDIRTVFGEFARQAHVNILVAPSVPSYKLDAYLITTSLRYALNKVTEATGLEWNLTADRSIQVRPPASSRVELFKN